MTMTVTDDKQDSPDGRLPAPRRASEELPELDRVRELGIPLDDLEMARLVACLLSAFLGRGRSVSRSHLKGMMTMLAAMCAVEVAHDGEVEAAPHPELDRVAWPDASTVFARLGIDAEALGAYWAEARDRVSDACYPVEWLLAFFPASIWVAVALLIEWGSERARVRLQQTLRMLAKRKTRKNRRRRPKGSPLAASTVDAWMTALLALMDELVQLRERLKASRQPALCVDLVEAWTSVPRRPSLREAGLRKSGQDNSGPSIEYVQECLHEFVGDYEANPAYPYHRLRRVVLLSLGGLLGPRATALRTTSVADFKPGVVGPDGARRAVLEIRPGKTWDADEVHRLPLPREVEGWVRDWIRITGRAIGEDSPLFPNRKSKPGLALDYMDEVSFYAAIAGVKSGNSGVRALVPLNGDPFVGYRPHALRHTSEKLIQRAAVELKAEHPGLLDHVTPDDFARAVLGHTLTRTTSDVYRDLDRERLTFLVIDKAWEILWGTGTTRMGIDPQAVKHARERVEAVETVIRALDRQLLQHVREQTTLAEKARRLQGDDLARLEITSRALAADTLALERELAQAQTQLEQSRAELERARVEEVALPDDLSEDEHARLLAEALAESTPPHTAEPDGPLADYLTVNDLALLFGTSEQTINRWYREGAPSGRPLPWDPSGWKSNGPRSKLLRVSALESSLLTVEQERILAELRRRRALTQSG